MGLFESIIEVVVDAIKDSGSSSGGVFSPPTTTTTGPVLPMSSPRSIVDTLEKVELLFTDVETEGQKRGYEKAASEYEDAFGKIEEEYRSTKRILDNEVITKEAKADKLIARLKELEMVRDALRDEAKRQEKKVSNRYNIPLQKVSQSAAAGTLLVSGTSYDILDLICAHKEKKLKESEEKGYREAKAEYRKKISDLKDNLQRLKAKSEAELAEITGLIYAVMEEIAKEETKIAELKVLLS